MKLKSIWESCKTWWLKPRAIRAPLWAWLIVGAVLLFLLTQQHIIPREYITERTIIVTATPMASPLATPRPGTSRSGMLAFTMRHNGNSDLYLLSQRDNKLLRLTFDPAADRDPAWSPDGRQLAFASHRAQNWDLYTIDIASGTILRLTRSPDFEANPTWSPDGRWLAYERYHDQNLDIYVLNVASGESLRLTHDAAPEYAPAWAPDGRHIAFTAYRNGNQDLYLISLDDGTTVNLTDTPDQNEDYPTWSPDGLHLAYSAGVPGDETIWMLPFDKEGLIGGQIRPTLFGVGGQPAWSPDGQSLAFIFRRQDQSYLIAADITGWAFAQEGYNTTDWMGKPDWTAASLPQEAEARLLKRQQEKDPPLYTELFVSPPNEHYRLIDLPDVNHSDHAEKLSDAVNDSFNAWRRAVKAQTGWDFLSQLGDSSRPMNYTPRPGQGRISWHVCGRAVDVDQSYLRRGLIELVREDIGGTTYWRVFIKAKKQDGSMGEPLRVAPWDLSVRGENSEVTAEGGKLKDKVPPGYYVDFTTIAADYGWERRNALSNWRTSYYDVEWWHFQKTVGMSWYDCMLEIYSTDEISQSYGILPWWTHRPEWEVQAMP